MSDQDNDSNQLIRQKLDTALDKIQSMAYEITYLVSQVGDLKSEIQAIKSSFNNKSSTDDFSSNITSNEGSTIDSPQNAQISKKGLVSADENITKGPFPKFKPSDRVVPRPSTKELANSVGKKSHSLQFTCNLYIDLITKVLGPSLKTNLDYKAMVKEAILVTKAVLSHIKENNNIDPDLRWSRLDPTIKLEAYRELESAIEHLLPLKVCSEFWGAHVLISNFWLKRKKKSNTTQNNSNNKERKKITNIENKNNSSPTLPISSTTIHDSSFSPSKEEIKGQKLKAFSIPFLTHQQ
jgi:hypothetical protein